MPGAWDFFATFPLTDDICMSRDELLVSFDDPRGGATLLRTIHFHGLSVSQLWLYSKYFSV